MKTDISAPTDVYRSIAAPSEGLYKELGSRFLAFAYPVETEDEARTILAGLRARYHDARHHCCAWRLGLDGSAWRASDDGEPAGSAGRPILGQIDSEGLSDILVVVVRYFGGIKLGVPGLIRAYKTATADALSNARPVDKVAGSWYRVGFGYESMPAVMKLVKDMDLPQRGRDWGTTCTLELRVRRSLEKDFLERISAISNFATQL
ncbi:MAG: YigZ family protein [Bacteroidales bacterium]|nr:YigZ family protein [Bacteroidales bacterium]